MEYIQVQAPTAPGLTPILLRMEAQPTAPRPTAPRTMSHLEPIII